MRVAGYVREAPGRGHSDTAFAQSERVRRWALDSGNELIAVCQDRHGTTSPTDRPGYRALLELVRSHAADAVVVATLSALSPDKVLQEIMIVDIRNAGATVVSTDEHDVEAMMHASSDHTRLVVRDVVEKVEEYRAAYGLSGDRVDDVDADHDDDDDDGHNVVVELISPAG